MICNFYRDFAPWWPLMSPPAEYAEEAAFYGAALIDGCRRKPTSLLELGSGGGNNASHMKAHFDSVTLVDASDGMLDVSRALNLDCEHITGDMRDVRLGRRFDCVFIHDAIAFMASESDLRRAIATAYEHCETGGVALLCPDYVRETFEPSTDSGGHDGADGRAMRYFAWIQADGASRYVVDYAYFMRERDGAVEVVHERQHEGLFGRADWLRWLGDAGFDAGRTCLDHTEVDRPLDVFVGRKP